MASKEEIFALVQLLKITNDLPELRAINTRARRDLKKAEAESKEVLEKELEEEAKKEAEEKAKAQAEAQAKAKEDEAKAEAAFAEQSKIYEGGNGSERRPLQ